MSLSLNKISDIAREAQIAFCLDKFPSFEIAFARLIEAAATPQAEPTSPVGAVDEGAIIRGMVALTHIGWAPDLRFDDDGHWKIQADTFCDLPWQDTPLAAWKQFVEMRLKDEPEARAALSAQPARPAPQDEMGKVGS